MNEKQLIEVMDSVGTKQSIDYLIEVVNSLNPEAKAWWSEAFRRASWGVR